jgi:hypothetical protein
MAKQEKLLGQGLVWPQLGQQERHPVVVWSRAEQ